MGRRADRLKVSNIARRIANGLAVHGLGVVVDELGDRLGGIVFGKPHFNTLARQHMREECIGAAIELRRRHDIVPSLSQREDRVIDRGHTRAHGESGNAPF